MKKFAFIMRGVPGSGKSTVAKYLSDKGAVVHSVDSYHTDNNKFLWDDDKENDHYQKNFESFEKSCKSEVDVVVCDCINITKDEYQKYVDVAKDNDYIVSFVVLDRPDSFLAAGRNKHDVSKEQIDEMYARWEN